MHPREFRRCLGMAALVLLAIQNSHFGEGSATLAAAERPPNFVVIFTDDQGYNDLGCFGSPDIKTPNIDRMADDGMKFTDFYVAAPVCSPSRAALLTGCYPQRLGINTANFFPSIPKGLNPDELTIAELLKTRGYATACVGKWHLGSLPEFLPTRQGFDSYYGIPYSNDIMPSVLLRDEDAIEMPVAQHSLTERYTRESVDFISANKDKPFFLYLAHNMPHTPLHVSGRFSGKSARGLYGDAVECIDWGVGQILETLKTLDIDKNTLVVFTSDNGPWRIRGDDGGSAYPLRNGKGTTFEGGMRVPCVMCWPGQIPAGRVCSEVASTIDLLPTFAKLAGAELPTDRTIDGKDISALLFGQPDAHSPHDVFGYYVGHTLEAVRSGDWKLAFSRAKKSAPKNVPYHVPVHTIEAEPESLFHMPTDPGEQHNVIDAHPEVAARLHSLADKMREEVGDGRTGQPGKGLRTVGVHQDE